MVGIFVFILLLVLFLTQFALVLFYTLRSDSLPATDQPAIDSVSVIIPFHNEEFRISKLLYSLNSQNIFPASIDLIFVDDHSTDETCKLIQNTLVIPFRIINSEDNRGKKFALHQGVLEAKNDFILTLDADVELDQDYFKNILVCPQTDMVILPVEMSGNRFFDILGSIEFRWLQVLTFGSSKPILCNGANLLFAKLAYLSSFKSRTDFDIASGDDAFLLQSFTHYKRRIQRIKNDALTVKTESPHTLPTLVKQRKRWVGKFKRMADQKSMQMMLLLIAIQIGFIVCVVLSFYHPVFLIPLALKFISETILIYNEKSISNPYFFLANLLHHFWYPLYLIILLLPAGDEERWKK